MIRQLLLLILIMTSVKASQPVLYITNRGFISFSSEASQELIKASSSNLRGVLDPENRTFVFKVLIRTFRGFNSALQQEHFNEKYLESEKYPEATFKGKIIEDIDFSIDGNYEVRAKGHLTIHGKEMERIIRCSVIVKNRKINIVSHFTILLSEHNIKVPKVVHEKIASEINVEVNTELSPKEKIE
jgi:hypothetical protein